MKRGHIVFVVFDSKYTSDGFTPVSSHSSDQKCTSDIIYICWHISYKKKKQDIWVENILNLFFKWPINQKREKKYQP